MDLSKKKGMLIASTKHYSLRLSRLFLVLAREDLMILFDRS